MKQKSRKLRLPKGLELLSQQDSKHDFKFTMQNRARNGLQGRTHKKFGKVVPTVDYTARIQHQMNADVSLNRRATYGLNNPKMAISEAKVIRENQPATENLQKKTKRNPLQDLLQQESLIDDSEIQILEKKLKIQGGQLSAEFQEDGLDFLLGYRGAGQDGTRMDSDFGDHDRNDTSTNSDYGQESINSERHLEFSKSSDEETKAVDLSNQLVQKTKSTSDIYGQNAYVPPHLRTATTHDEKLCKILQGQINRLSTQNMESIVQFTVELSQDYSRNEMNTSITTIVVNSVADSANLLDSFCGTFAVYLTALYNIIGLEFGAHLIQHIVTMFLVEYKKRVAKGNNFESIGDKKCTNLGLLLSYLYTLGVIGHVLVYDIIRNCIQSLEEIDLEILKRFLSVCGFQLRKDDPGALKEIVRLLEQSISTKTATPRMKFLAESINDIKNNKKRNATTEGKSTTFRKLLQIVLKKRNIKLTEPLGVSLDDIRNIDIKGKWWLIGHSWKGNDSDSKVVDKGNQSSLVELAKLHRMNTDTRKLVFITIMSSEDYLDCFQKLLKLGLPSKQQRDIIRVLVHCLCREKSFNLYYCLVIKEFIMLDRSYGITFQYTLWDALTEKAEENAVSYEHLGQLVSFLAVSGTVSLQIIKKIDLLSLQDFQKLFIRTMLRSIVVGQFQSYSKGTWTRPFRKLVGIDENEQLLFGLKLFLKQEFKGDESISPRIKELRDALKESKV